MKRAFLVLSLGVMAVVGLLQANPSCPSSCDDACAPEGQGQGAQQPKQSQQGQEPSESKSS